MSVTLEILGLEDLVRASEGMLEARKVILARLRKELVARLSEYPPPIPRQKYKRTFRLRRGWQRAAPIATTTDTVQIINPVEYAAAVQGEPGVQRSAFRGRWKPAQDILDDLQPELRAAVGEGLEDLIVSSL